MVEKNALVQCEPGTNGRRFIISLIARRNEPTLVRSCEIKGSTFNNRTSFGEGVTLRHAFAAPLVRALDDCLSKLSYKTEVLSLPEFLCEVAGLTLRGIHVMATRLADGAINIIMRFLSFVGGINHALAPEIGFDDPVHEEGQAIATKVLEDIAAPLLNICTSAVLGLKDTNEMLGAFGRKIASQTDEIQFRTHLLRRYVERRASAMAPPPTEVLLGLEQALNREAQNRRISRH
ncbi:hypothetical protein [uncultured Sulfitobacter sp.]|uniref:hypothetical protein n=1 Tax=uncultured Sulfitobacter sp. TaxID=191468 RepID=UPI00260F916B|nr:hypothetical protein [uncultured Sulfitobacter sp.]